MSDEKDYTLLEDDLFSPGSRIKLDHVLYLNEYDISELLDKSVEEVRELYNESFKKEESMYEVLQAGLKAWEHDAAQTRKLQLALNYLEIAPVEHTGNQWTEDKNGVRTISNSVYKMTCKLSENPKWNLWSAKPLNDRWLVEWEVTINSPKLGHWAYKNGELQDSCWGFIGSVDKACRDIAEYLPDECKGMTAKLSEVNDPASMVKTLLKHARIQVAQVAKDHEHQPREKSLDAVLI